MFSWNDYTRRLGRYLGFPLCCIESFIYTGIIIEKRKLCGTGYVPCKSCNDNLTELELADIINERRECPDTFPNWKSAGTIKENEQFVGQLNDYQD